MYKLDIIDIYNTLIDCEICDADIIISDMPEMKEIKKLILNIK